MIAEITLAAGLWAFLLFGNWYEQRAYRRRHL